MSLAHHERARRQFDSTNPGVCAQLHDGADVAKGCGNAGREAGRHDPTSTNNGGTIVRIVSFRTTSVLTLSLLALALVPAACAHDEPAPRESVASAGQAITQSPAHEWLFAENGGTT